MIIKKGDNIKIMAGKDKGKTGNVIEVDSKLGRVLIEKLNLMKKHVRPKKQGQAGQIIEAPRKIDISNVMIICGQCKKASRISLKRDNDKKVRICKKCQATI